METKCWERCKKVCWGRCEKVLWGVGKGEGRCGEVWKSVLGCRKGKKKFGDVGKCWLLGRCGKVCWNMEEVCGGCGKVLGGV